MEAMTAAHKRLPFGSIVEVENRDNGRTTRVRINDRGPFVRGRIIDLSKAAARETGHARRRASLGFEFEWSVRFERVRATNRRRASALEPRDFTVQAGAFRDPARAEARLAAVRVHTPVPASKPRRGFIASWSPV